MRITPAIQPLVMHKTSPPRLETFSHWPSWLNAYKNLDRSACFELRVSQVRRLAGCIPLMKDKFGQWYRHRNRRADDLPDLPNERKATTFSGRISRGHYDITAYELDLLSRQQMPRRLAGDWRTGRAPAMRRGVQDQPSGMTLEQGGHGQGERAYERKLAYQSIGDALPAPALMQPGLPVDLLDAGLDVNPNRGSSREKMFGLNEGWTQRLEMEKHHHASVSGKQYLLVCPCGQTAYKLFWVLARPEEHRDAELAEAWTASLTSGQLSRRSAEVAALTNRFGPIMSDDRKLLCRHCLKMNYGKSPKACQKNNLRRKRRANTARRSSIDE